MIGSVLGSLVPTLIAIVGGAFWIGDKLGSLETKVEGNSGEISKLRESLNCDENETGGEQ